MVSSRAYLILSIFILIIPFSILTYGFLGSSFLRLLDEQYPLEAKTGDILLINGTMISAVNKDMRVSLTLQSNRTEGLDWNLIDTKPSKTFILPFNRDVHYQFKVSFFKPGKFFMQSKADIVEVVNSTAIGLPMVYQSVGATISVVPIPPTPAQLKECKELGIPSYQCSDQKILEHKCIGINCNPEPQTNEKLLFNSDMLLYWSVLAVVLGGLSLLFLMRVRVKKKEVSTK